jgi:hypothetical protein
MLPFCPKCGNKTEANATVCAGCGQHLETGRERLTDAAPENKRAALDYALSKSNNFVTLALAGVAAYFAIVTSMLLPVNTPAGVLPPSAFAILFLAYIADSLLTGLFVLKYSFYTDMLTIVAHAMPIQFVLSEAESITKGVSTREIEGVQSTRAKILRFSWSISEWTKRHTLIVAVGVGCIWSSITGLLVVHYVGLI